MSGRRIARVVLDSPLPQLDRLFDYSIPDALAAEAQPGVRVRVPLRVAGRVVDGFILECADEPDAERPLSAIDSVVSPVPVLPRTLYDLARRLADRAAGSASDILRLAVPRRMVRAERTWLAAEPVSAVPVADEAVAAAHTLLGTVPGLEADLRADRRIALTPPARPAGDSPHGPLGMWARVLAACAVNTLARGRSAVLVVPDHRDLAHLHAALTEAGVADAVVSVDADHSAPERYASYLRVLAPRPLIVIGNRSAVYAPVHELGLLAIWDDGDPLLREPLSPGVHARDAALIRQEQHGGALVIAGHTRTTDAERLVELGWLQSRSPVPVAAPSVVLTPLHEGESAGARIPSAAYRAAQKALTRAPVLVQVARPGYAPVLTCAQCRQPARCPECAGPLHARARGATPVCTWCGRRADAWTCGACGGEAFRLVGAGTLRTAEELGRAFPGVRIIVADGEHRVDSVDGSPALVIATRGAAPPAAEGYGAVLLLDGERMLLADDLRIAEHCLRWWSNAAALAAPGAPVHLVGVSGALGRALATWTQPAFARAELAERASLRMPPAVRVASVEGPRDVVESALGAVRTEAPSAAQRGILGPVLLPDGTTWRALVRFDYAEGAPVAAALRAAVVADALRGRRSARARGTGARTTLRVRLDLADVTLEVPA